MNYGHNVISVVQRAGPVIEPPSARLKAKKLVFKLRSSYLFKTICIKFPFWNC